jgi:general stress protein 26
VSVPAGCSASHLIRPLNTPVNRYFFTAKETTAACESKARAMAQFVIMGDACSCAMHIINGTAIVLIGCVAG